MKWKPTNEQYNGQWTNDKRHGYGMMTYGDQSTYTGEWENDKRHGKGKLEDKNGKIIYDGRWNKGRQVGGK